MAPLWRKAKIDRVSRLVADLLSSKRAADSSPLVVLTGFPTSLIDLIVKNRDRLKKPSRSTANINLNHNLINRKSSSDGDDSFCSVSALIPLGSFNSLSVAFDSADKIDEVFERAIADCDVCSLNLVNAVVEEEVVEVSVANQRSFLLIIELFLLLILVLGSKNIAFGVTASAFVLMFLEFTGKCLIGRLICLFRQFAVGRNCVNSFVQNVLVYVQPEKHKCLDLSEWESDAVEEIEVVQPDSDCRISCRDTKLDEEGIISLKDKYIVMEDEIVAVPRKTSGAKLKAKLLKKLVILKKIRRSKSKKSKEQGVFRSSFVIPSCDDKGVELIVGEEKNDETELVERGLERICEEHRSAAVLQLCCDGEVVENAGRKASWNWMRLLPLLIILVGLLGGRTMALAVTMAWCVVVKLAKLQRIRR
ncbi:hypothetical protein Syun_009501 [Stephania yunnanensis]|uniref:Transmembrane protein n=1 Tax=Stephania yunnanensis TaxID=152371 RepID=A0AAP0PP36_9MAGN